MPINSQKYPLHQSPLFKLRNRGKLIKWLGITGSDLRRLCKYADTLYSEFEVQKKSGGTRGVENPARELKLVQARLARLLARITPPDYLFCPVKGRCYVGNAAQHRGNRVISCLDIRKYFPSTPSRRVFWFFRNVMQCERDIAAVLTRLATYCGHLPTGSPLSPIMAYFAHYDVWESVASITRQHGYVLTVYIDDVTISGKSLSSQVLWQIKKAIHRSGLRYHKEKTYVGCPAEITGVIIAKDRILVPNRQLKKLHEIGNEIRYMAPGRPIKALQDRHTGLKGQVSQIAAFGSKLS